MMMRLPFCISARVVVLVVATTLLLLGEQPSSSDRPGGAVLVRADFGDYVDPTFNCPATTTCPTICVKAASDCPTRCANGRTLCIDGNCEIECNNDALESPCQFDCASFACAKVVDNYDACFVKFGTNYTDEAECGDTETEQQVKKFQFNETGFVVVYAWASIVTVLILAWCFYK